MVAMFSKEEDGTEHGMVSAGETTAQTVIGPTVKVEGVFESEDNILIEGHVTGTIRTTKNLTVGKDASIEADVSAENMHIAGEVKGNIVATHIIELTSTARIIGDIETDIISIETGAMVQGRCVSGTKPAATVSQVVAEEKVD
ncbi:MAG: hypothetical protein COW24_04810 [Candidatus Kerfeldbacteria bacterium CG15_BIG_FIL_POST_REV_8_21_14_020_45_12]|uniref:Cell shape determination protein CcmA n=1 Tax=Candidatus Kerfeldbacteria bacterium CG15_BIG_FIL_POST_REV_8_21_14_020_45_12 TaxID=2014247 RepID=A0A2M7H2P9_9BACT|nr:MAG: hypothetical protein COW24_04810 [Candidatus Kerfeldbacteria bacterium CG15_BIG_FIL_POST_REV_8_21_14_020_45_12]PJA93262.1 MAG: hypothetical protein CO132_04110 [Candidatus Kerfeldbacteria bacterium CG_4_9_14_3_um_filter_45_8]